jgi:hypothetical protein
VNANDTADAEPPTLVAKVSEVLSGKDDSIAVELTMLAAGMFDLAACSTATVRVAKFAACTSDGALSPEAALKVHA